MIIRSPDGAARSVRAIVIITGTTEALAEANLPSFRVRWMRWLGKILVFLFLVPCQWLTPLPSCQVSQLVSNCPHYSPAPRGSRFTVSKKACSASLDTLTFSCLGFSESCHNRKVVAFPMGENRMATGTNSPGPAHWLNSFVSSCIRDPHSRRLDQFRIIEWASMRGSMFVSM